MNDWQHSNHNLDPKYGAVSYSAYVSTTIDHWANPWIGLDWVFQSSRITTSNIDKIR